MGSDLVALPSLFDDLDRFLQASQFKDAWSDDGCCSANRLIFDFSDEDWENLAAVIVGRGKLWKLSLAQALSGITTNQSIAVLVSLMREPDEELFYEAAVTLEENIRSGAELGIPPLEVQGLIEQMKRQTGKELLGVWSLEAEILRLIAQKGHP
jgi:hypothetical protein